MEQGATAVGTPVAGPRNSATAGFSTGTPAPARPGTGISIEIHDGQAQNHAQGQPPAGLALHPATGQPPTEQERQDEQLARQLQAQEMRAPPSNMVIGQPVSHAAHLGFHPRSDSNVGPNGNPIAGGVPTTSPHAGTRVDVGTPGALLFLAAAPTREEQRIIRILYYAGTVQCIVLLNFVFTFVSIMYPSPYKTALALIAPLGLTGFVGARKFSVPWLSAYQGYLVLELSLRSFLAFQTASDSDDSSHSDSDSSSSRAGDDDPSQKLFWLFLFGLVNAYIFLIVQRLKGYIKELNADELRDLCRGDINARGRRVARTPVLGARYPHVS
eukprot:CAMPEP_0178987142 /NCGR_PEP_ID=MMETSP0795-20121207/3096_1 /TAXON_ID=88552 /ORGANISM="Amoebophrya sp., Strain Ameob2" /LENGTH=327 /DNA_ID=CAMNT_0020678283 /DNA_START=537 /DNA_END=1520 /DNA_ORIENTATION=-